MKLLMGLVLSAVLVTSPWIRASWAEEHSGCMCGMMGHGEPHGGKDAGMHIHMLLKHAKELDLTKEQVTKLKKIDFDRERNRVKTEAEIRVAEMDITAMVEDEKADLTAVENRLKQKAALETGLRMTAIKAGREAHALLTPEQREKAEAEHEAMMEEQHEQMGGMCGEMKKKMGGDHGDSSKKNQREDEPAEHHEH